MSDHATSPAPAVRAQREAQCGRRWALSPGALGLGPALVMLAAVGAAEPAPVVTPASSPGQGFDVARYDVVLRPDLATASVAGRETVVLRATEDGLARIVFSPNALAITDASIDGVPVAVTSGPAGLVFAPPRPLAKGARATLRFSFAGKPARGVAAAAGGLHASYFACDWMVCLQDVPGDKAWLTLDLLLPPGMNSAGVGRATRPVRAAGGLERHRWRATRPYSAYLYGFAAGPFPRQVQGRFTYIDATGTRADLAAVFAQTAAISAFFADKAGVPLPDGRYVQILTGGDEAQETASFSLIGKEELNGERADPLSAWVIAHELAHQWWGNLVTCASWREFWLNEGIATFMVAAWKEHSLGPAGYARELDIARERVARVRKLGFDKRLAWGGKYPSLGARRAVQYSKGMLFLAHLRTELGDAAFWSGLRRFTQEHAGGTVTSRDLQTAMERASGRDLSATFAQWVYGT